LALYFINNEPNWQVCNTDALLWYTGFQTSGNPDYGTPTSNHLLRIVMFKTRHMEDTLK